MENKTNDNPLFNEVIPSFEHSFTFYILQEENKKKVLFLKKKNKAREEIAKTGALKKEGENTFDHYNYITEAQYKALANKIFISAGLEFRASVLEISSFEGSEKQPNGKTVKMTFFLADIDTGYEEAETFFGEALDKGDKALYKAYTGALKYYIASNFLVEGGDDAEKDSPEATRKSPSGQIPLCSICGKTMLISKTKGTPYCKHGTKDKPIWGRPIDPSAIKISDVPIPQKTQEEIDFENALM